MNLLVAPEEVPTVVDVRRGGRDALGRRIGAGHRLAQRQAVAGIRVHEPDPHPVPVGRRRAIRAPWLAAVFDIDPEHHAPPVALAVGHRVVPRAREADLVRRRAPRLGPADAVVRIAQRAHHAHGVRVFRTGEAGALQAVEAARVEVAVQPLLNVTHMRPFAGDARGVGRERCRDPDRRAHLTSMRGVDRRARTGVGRARERPAGIAEGVIRAARVHSPATGHPTGGLRATLRRRYVTRQFSAPGEGLRRVARGADVVAGGSPVEAPGEGQRRVAPRLLAAGVGDLAGVVVIEAPGEGQRRVAPRLLAAGAGHLAGVVVIEAPGERLRRVAPRLFAAGAGDLAGVVVIEAPGERLRRVAARLLAAGAGDLAGIVVIEAPGERLRRIAARLLAAGAGDLAGVVVIEAPG